MAYLHRNIFRIAVPLMVALGVSGCASGPDDDPLETTNRAVHSVNVGLDRAVLRPGSQIYGATLPQVARSGVNNFSQNMSVPGTILNDVLQLSVEDALHNTTRFLVNSTLGLAGLFDVASAVGVPPRPSDFGETLHVWGFGEGAYIELPVLGPSTTRDTIGFVVDTAMNPVARVATVPQMNVILGAKVGQTLDQRYSFGNTLDSILYESADSYTQSRLLFLQNRRFNLGQSADAEDDLYDLYEETFE